MKNFAYLMVLAVLFTACKKNKTTTEDTAFEKISDIDFDKIPLKNLSDYAFFKGKLTDFKAAEGVIPYEPVSSLFSDYALKKRYVWMPEGTSATIPDDPDDPLDFPEKTILIKNFYFPADYRHPDENKRMIETRLLVKYKEEWQAYAYLWNDEQTDAVLKNIGAVVPVNFISNSGEKVDFNYVVPQKTQCRSCHNRDEKFLPIGPKGKQLNHDYAFEDGKENQLVKWKSLGILKTDKELAQIKSLVNPMDESQPLAIGAKSYLDANCAYCHIIGGPASTSGLYLNIEEPSELHQGIRKSPVAAGMGGGGFKYDINPGHGMESVITYRMSSTHPGVMMPEFGRVTVHKEAVELIARWIDSLK